MSRFRLIARLDVKGPNLIKGVHLEGLRVMGDPGTFARAYYEQGIDELIFMDTVASLYGRNNLLDIVSHTARNIFVPMTVGGGIRNIEDARLLLTSGADKIAVNTAATERPELIADLASTFGSQAVVVGIEAKRRPGGLGWMAYTNNGREVTALDVEEWSVRVAKLGAGEILLTSVDREGTAKGLDLELGRRVTAAVNIPVILSGGAGSASHVVESVSSHACDAVAIAHILHYGKETIAGIRRAIQASGAFSPGTMPA